MSKYIFSFELLSFRILKHFDVDCYVSDQNERGEGVGSI